MRCDNDVTIDEVSLLKSESYVVAKVDAGLVDLGILI